MRGLTAILLLGLLAVASARQLQEENARICIYCSSKGRKSFTAWDGDSVACKYGGKTVDVPYVMNVQNRAAKTRNGCPVNLIIDDTEFTLTRTQYNCGTDPPTECAA